ncbi:MAG: TetR/AcrR family transcriptional regulator [Deltaproteobacteria bacterium]|nr:TetR/AcrR family transcriptional regulator [Deltaproteobacteria bacterium]
MEAAPEREADVRRRHPRPPPARTAAAVVRHGVDGCTVQHILDAAGVSRRTFYRWFRDRDDALDALYEVSIALVVGTLQLSVAGRPRRSAAWSAPWTPSSTSRSAAAGSSGCSRPRRCAPAPAWPPGARRCWTRWSPSSTRA